MVERRPAYQRILLKLSGEALAGDADMVLTRRY
jgi:uridylate kinase